MLCDILVSVKTHTHKCVDYKAIRCIEHNCLMKCTISYTTFSTIIR